MILYSPLSGKGMHSQENQSAAQTETIFSIFTLNSYTVGSPIWIYYEDIDELGILCLPQSFNQRGCTTASPIRYMEDLESRRKCQRHLYFDEECSAPEFNINYYFDSFKIVKSPEHFKNFTDKVPKAEYPFLEMDYMVCSKNQFGSDDGDTICEKKRGFELLALQPNKLCRNIVTGVDFEIHHDGTNGISKVLVSIELSDFSSNRTFWEYLDEDFMIIEQAFSYQHVWNTDNITAISKLSGRPGYQNGAPIRSGKIVQVKDAEMNSGNGNEGFSTSKRKDLWKIERNGTGKFLTVMGATLSGDCNDVLPINR